MFAAGSRDQVPRTSHNAHIARHKQLICSICHLCTCTEELRKRVPSPGMKPVPTLMRIKVDGPRNPAARSLAFPFTLSNEQGGPFECVFQRSGHSGAAGCIDEHDSPMRPCMLLFTAFGWVQPKECGVCLYFCRSGLSPPLFLTLASALSWGSSVFVCHLDRTRCIQY